MSFETRAIADAGIAVLDCEHKTPQAQHEGHPYIAIPDIQDGRVRLEKVRRISFSDLELWTRRTAPRAGDILVTRRGRVGDTAPIPANTRCAIGQNLVLLRSDGETVRQDFLRWAVRGPQWWAEVTRLMNVGAVFSSLNVRDIARIEIPIPEPQEQQAIADVLGGIDAKLAVNNRIIRTTMSLMTARYAQSLDDVSAESVAVESLVRKLVQPRKLSKLDVSGDGTVPIFDQSDGGLLGYASGDGCLMASPSQPVLYFGDHTCKLRISTQDFFAGPNTIPFVGDGVETAILFCALEGVQKHEEYKRHWQSLMKKRVVLPSAGHQNELVDIFASFLALRGSLQAENRHLVALRDTLLPELMSGRLRVKDAEKKIEEVV